MSGLPDDAMTSLDRTDRTHRTDRTNISDTSRVSGIRFFSAFCLTSNHSNPSIWLPSATIEYVPPKCVGARWVPKPATRREKLVRVTKAKYIVMCHLYMCVCVIIIIIIIIIMIVIIITAMVIVIICVWQLLELMISSCCNVLNPKTHHAISHNHTTNILHCTKLYPRACNFTVRMPRTISLISRAR